jgi:Uma2 family endonuclease
MRMWPWRSVSIRCGKRARSGSANVLSPSTALNDVGRKFAKYEEYGVQEHWVLDPKSLAHRFYERRDNLLAEFGENEEIILQVNSWFLG